MEKNKNSKVFTAIALAAVAVLAIFITLFSNGSNDIVQDITPIPTPVETIIHTPIPTLAPIIPTPEKAIVPPPIPTVMPSPTPQDAETSFRPTSRTF